jgi:hypothetical protein
MITFEPQEPTTTLVSVRVDDSRWSYAVWVGTRWVSEAGSASGSHAGLTAIAVDAALRIVVELPPGELVVALKDGVCRRLLQGDGEVGGAGRFSRLIRDAAGILRRLEFDGWSVSVVDLWRCKEAWRAYWDLGAWRRGPCAAERQEDDLLLPRSEPSGAEEYENDMFAEADPPSLDDWEEAGFPTAAGWAEWAAAGWDGAPWTAGVAYLTGLDPHTELTADAILNPSSAHAGVE